MQVKTGPSLRGLRSWALHMCYILAMNYHLCVLLLTKPDSSVGGASAVGSWRQLGSHYSRSLCTIKPADRQLGRYSQSENKNLEFKLSRLYRNRVTRQIDFFLSWESPSCFNLVSLFLKEIQSIYFRLPRYKNRFLEMSSPHMFFCHAVRMFTPQKKDLYKRENKVVAATWGTELLLQFLAALNIMHQQSQIIKSFFETLLCGRHRRVKLLIVHK